jgi:hypothetical protein
LPAGTPEFVSVHGSPTFIPSKPSRVDGSRVLPGIPARMGTRHTVTYRTTVAGSAKYILQRQTASGWQTVDSTGSVLRVAQGGFASDSFHTLHDVTSGAFTGYRVCKVALLKLRVSLTLCSESSSYASEGMRRVH